MNLPSCRSTLSYQPLRMLVAFICIASLSLAVLPLPAQLTTEEQAPKIPNEKLDALVAPIALYPDPLLAQTLAASTYPLELTQLQQWMANNKHLKDQALADAVEKQPWDPSVQAMAAFPDVVKLLADNIAWAMDLGNAFLAQQADVLEAVQRMRGKAESKGNLKSGPEQTVQTQTVEGGEQVIVIEPADPETVYVPSYNPTLVYGDAFYAYPMYYPPPGYYATGAALAFGAGVVLGAAWGGGWGYNCGWAHGDVDTNYNNKYIKNSNKNNNISSRNRPSQQPSGGKWQHSPQHRGGAPYGDKGTANKYGGRARSQPIGAAATNRSSSGITSSGAINRSAGNMGMNRAGDASQLGGSRAGANRVGGGSGLGGGPSTGIRPSAVGSGFSGGDRAGKRSVSPGSGYGSSSNAFGSGGFSGNSARVSSSRGHSSFGGGGGASFSGGHGGGGFHGGGGRGGGGRRR